MPLPFQNLSLNNLTDVFQWFIMSWMFLGMLAMLGIFAASCLLKKLKVDRLGVFRRRRFRSVALALLLLAFLFGLTTGTFEAWTYRRDLQRPAPHWYDFVAIAGAPGDMMANAYAGDWQDDEAWDYRSDIALWNGCFWTSVMAVGAFVGRFVFRNLDSFAPQVPDASTG